jgi:hypothetical protein
MQQSTSIQPLDYAPPRSVNHFGVSVTLLVLFGACGLAMNLLFVTFTMQGLHRAHWVHHDLMQNPRAYGREIAPQTIATLRRPYALWASHGGMIVASSFGMLLAINLLVCAAQVRRRFAQSVHRIQWYIARKAIGAAITSAVYFWSGSASWEFWVAATRHIPLGSGPPLISTALLLLCALIPWWWAKRAALRVG